MSTLQTLTIASIKMFVRNKQALFFTLFTPLIIMVIFGVIGFDRVSKVDIGLVSENQTPATQEFIKALKEFPTFEIHEGSLEAEKKELDEGNRALLLEIPGDFMNVEVRPPIQKTIKASINEGEQPQAQTALSVIRQMLDKTTLKISGAPELFTVESSVINSRNLKYIDFLLPGLIALSIMQMSVFSVAFGFVQFKEKGILKRILATPLKPSTFVIANTITRLIIAVMQTAIFVAVGVLAFDANVIGSYWLVLLVVILGATMFLGLGFSISGVSKTTESVPAIANLVVFPMLFLGGAFFDINNMPAWLRAIARFLPLTYFSTALRDVMTKDATFGDIKLSLLGMLIWCIILIFLASLTFSFQEKDTN